MISYSNPFAIALLLLAWHQSKVADAFSSSRLQTAPLAVAAQGFAPPSVENTPSEEKSESSENDISTLSADEAKAALVELIPRMAGDEEDYRMVESYVNLLEEKYSPVQTLDFLNLAMTGEWQLLFSTNLMGRPNRKLRLRELVQKIEADGFNGTLINMAQWDYAEDQENFDATGNFNVKCSYSISQGSRMAVDVDDLQLLPAKGSVIPGDVPALVGLLHRALPKELFDPNGHAMDTTYLDADLRVVRLTGPNHEGVRNIFMRKGSLEIKPM